MPGKDVPKRMKITGEFINRICSYYDDIYDDSVEDSSIGGTDWKPGEKAEHKSLTAFQSELEDYFGISLSTTKIRKILISGGCYSTELSRSVAKEYEKYGNVKKVADILELSWIRIESI